MHALVLHAVLMCASTANNTVALHASGWLSAKPCLRLMVTACPNLAPGRYGGSSPLLSSILKSCGVPLQLLGCASSSLT